MEPYNAWNGYLLVLSNLSFVIPVYVLLWRSPRGHITHWSWEIADYLAITMLSSLYHACDTPTMHNCVAPFDVLQRLDFIWSFCLFHTAVSPHLPYYTWRGPYRVAMMLCTLMFMLLWKDAVFTIPVLATVNAIAFLMAAWRRLWFTHANWCKYNQYYVVFAALFLGAAVFCKFTSNMDGNSSVSEANDYAIKHSLWHIFAALASSCLHLWLDTATLTVIVATVYSYPDIV